MKDLIIKNKKELKLFIEINDLLSKNYDQIELDKLINQLNTNQRRYVRNNMTDLFQLRSKIKNGIDNFDSNNIQEDPKKIHTQDSAILELIDSDKKERENKEKRSSVLQKDVIDIIKGTDDRKLDFNIDKLINSKRSVQSKNEPSNIIYLKSSDQDIENKDLRNKINSLNSKNLMYMTLLFVIFIILMVVLLRK